jgi:hypothetical protein
LPHRQQQQGGNPATEKRNKKDVKYKFPWIRPEPFPMLRLFIWLEKGGRLAGPGLFYFFGCRHWTSNAISERGKTKTKERIKQRERI